MCLILSIELPMVRKEEVELTFNQPHPPGALDKGGPP